MENLSYFTGKVCTVYTQPVNRTFNDQQHANSFCGVVIEVNEMGIWMSMLPELARKGFYAAPAILAIVEESITPITDEQETEIKQAFAQEIASQPKSDTVSLESIRNLAKNAKEKFQRK